MSELNEWCDVSVWSSNSIPSTAEEGLSMSAREPEQDNMPAVCTADEASAIRRAEDSSEDSGPIKDASIDLPNALDFEKDLEPLDAEGTAQERWQRTDAYMRDVQQAFKTKPSLQLQGYERYLKVLLVGEPGLGKEQFIKNAFAAYCAESNLTVNHCPPETSAEVFLRTPSDFCTDICLDIDAGHTKIHYLVQDTPGSHTAGVEASILKHIFKQSQDYMAKEEDPRRIVPLSSLPDPRVDVVLFFLSPHYLKPQDVELMARISGFVPLVPIIAKADALTNAELGEYRQHVRTKLEEASMRLGRSVSHVFSQEDLRQAGAVREVPPFAIITSQEVDLEVGSHWFTREYPWGKCEVMASNHSDLPALKSLLFECCFESLKAATEARFYSARESYLTTRALSRALSSDASTHVSEPHNEVSVPLAIAEEQTQQGTSAVPASPTCSSPAHHGQSPAAVLKTVLACKKRASTEKGGKWGWGWSVTLTVGVISLAVLAQWATYRYYSKNMSQLEAIIAHVRQESHAERQVIADLLRELGVMHGDLFGSM